MSNNAPDYENNLVFPPQEIKSQDDLNTQGRQSDVLIKAIEKLEKQLKIAVEALDSLRGICFPERAEQALEQIKELDK